MFIHFSGISLRLHHHLVLRIFGLVYGDVSNHFYMR
jgi:hypothetical protein